MGKAFGAEIDLVKTPIENLNFGEGSELTFRLDGRNWKLADPSTKEYSISAVQAGQERPGGPGRGGWYAGTGAQDERRPVTSPNGKLEAIVQDNNVLIREVRGGAKVLASKDGNMGDRYFGQFFWSPDSKHLVALRSTVVPQRKVTFVEAAPRDQLQPKVHSNDYTKPGDPLPIQRPQLFNIAEKRQVPVSDELCPNPYAITRIQWASDSSRFTYIFNQRGHQLLRLISVDAFTGASRFWSRKRLKLLSTTRQKLGWNFWMSKMNWFG